MPQVRVPFRHSGRTTSAFVTYTQALAADDTALQDAATERLKGFNATSLRSCPLRHKGAWAHPSGGRLSMHEDLLIRQINAFAERDYSTAYQLSFDAYQHMFALAAQAATAIGDTATAQSPTGGRRPARAEWPRPRGDGTASSDRSDGLPLAPGGVASQHLRERRRHRYLDRVDCAAEPRSSPRPLVLPLDSRTARLLPRFVCASPYRRGHGAERRSGGHPTRASKYRGSRAPRAGGPAALGRDRSDLRSSWGTSTPRPDRRCSSGSASLRPATRFWSNAQTGRRPVPGDKLDRYPKAEFPSEPHLLPDC